MGSACRGTEEGSSGRVQASRETVANEIKKVMSSIDPEVLAFSPVLDSWDWCNCNYVVCRDASYTKSWKE